MGQASVACAYIGGHWLWQEDSVPALHPLFLSANTLGMGFLVV